MRKHSLLKTYSLLVLCCSLLLSLMVSSPHTEARKRKKQKMGWYVVRPGDSCWSIAEKLFGDGRYYHMIHRYNKLGKLPHILTPGQRLRVPGDVATADANVAWKKRKVDAKPPRSVDWRKAYKKMKLWRLYRVRTGQDSLAGIEFIDKSHLRMQERATIVILGSSAQRIQAKRLVKRTVVVEKGAVEGGLASLDATAKSKKKTMSIKTPSSSIKLQSTSSRIEVSPKKTTLVSIYQGQAKVRAQGKEVLVPKDYGTVVKMGQRPQKPRRLPSAPKWREGRQHALILAPRDALGQVTLRWRPVSNASRYRIEWSDSRRFRQIMRSLSLPATGPPQYTIKKLRHNKNYYVRISTRAPSGLQSLPSRVFTIRVLPLRMSREPRRIARNSYELSGWVKVLPSKGTEQILQASENGSPYQGFPTGLRLTTPKLYRLRFRIQGTKLYSSEIQLNLLKSAGTIALSMKQMKYKGSPVPFTLRVLDSKGHPSFPPQLQVRAYPGGNLALKPIGKGRFSGSLRYPGDYKGKRIWVVASWPGGELGRTSVKVIHPPAARPKPRPRPRPRPKPLPPKAFEWPVSPSSASWYYPSPGLPSRSFRPLTYAGISANFHRMASPWEKDKTISSLALGARGQIALLKQRLGIDFEMPWMQVDVSKDESNRSRLGNLSLGIHYSINLKKDFWLTPTMRMVFPTGGFERGSKTVDIHTGIAAAWRISPTWYLSTNQILAIQAGTVASSSTIYSSSYQLSKKFHKYFSASLGVDLFIGRSGAVEKDMGLVGLGIEGAFYFHYERARIGLSMGGGLTEAARYQMGEFVLGLTFDLAFPSLFKSKAKSK